MKRLLLISLIITACASEAPVWSTSQAKEVYDYYATAYRESAEDDIDGADAFGECMRDAVTAQFTPAEFNDKQRVNEAMAEDGALDDCFEMAWAL